MTIRIRLSANRMIFSAGVRLVTWNDYSHCDFLLEDGSYLGAIPFPGVCIHGLSEPKEAFFEYSSDPETEKKILDYAKSQIGKTYDFSGIVGFAAHRDWQDESKWFCSELVAASFHAAGVKLFNEDAYKISPRDVDINPLLRKIEKPAYAK